MEELDARAFRGHLRSLEGGRNPATNEPYRPKRSIDLVFPRPFLAAIVREGRGQGARRPCGDNDARKGCATAGSAEMDVRLLLQRCVCLRKRIQVRMEGCDNDFAEAIRSSSIAARWLGSVLRPVMKHSAAMGRPVRSRTGAAMHSRNDIDRPSVQQ
ncbi:hypothetical protein PMI06_007145 [Burkholderia sp. BT03]|nr:hypothetical protein PMI06_007145 [Burkholderia sp. BT03]SKC91138.1 hypothetical protein SAMN06266956_4749 [Paraburkholderia hospita]